MRGNARDKFVCPGCKKVIHSKVRDTEPCYNGYKRYRSCEECGIVFVTMEKVSYIPKERKIAE